MTPFITAILALGRRFLTASGSAILTYIGINYVSWLETAFKGDEKTAALWGLVYLVIEFLWKYKREKAKV
jgi:hypothetical protein